MLHALLSPHLAASSSRLAACITPKPGPITRLCGHHRYRHVHGTLCCTRKGKPTHPAHRGTNQECKDQRDLCAQHRGVHCTRRARRALASFYENVINACFYHQRYKFLWTGPFVLPSAMVCTPIPWRPDLVFRVHKRSAIAHE
jgi:hypothetical protein